MADEYDNGFEHYEVDINGIGHRLQLDQETAEAYGAAAVPAVPDKADYGKPEEVVPEPEPPVEPEVEPEPEPEVPPVDETPDEETPDEETPEPEHSKARKAPANKARTPDNK